MTAALVRVPDDYGSGGSGLSPSTSSLRFKPLAKVLQGLYDAITGTSGSQPNTVVFEARFASTANVVIASNNLTAVDGVTPVAGNVALLKNQTTPAENGLYVVVAAGPWTRLKDAAGGNVISSGMVVTVSEGTVNADSAWLLATNAAISVGVTSLTFQAFADPATAAPAAIGTTAAVGTSLLYARQDHVHIYPAAQYGTATLSSGTFTVSTAAITANSVIIPVLLVPAGTRTSHAGYKVTSITPGAPGSFVVTGVNDAGATLSSETSTFMWFVIG